MLTIEKITNVKLVRKTTKKIHNPLFIYFPGMDGTGDLLHLQINNLKANFEVITLSISPCNLTNWHTMTLTIIELIKGELLGRKNRSIYICGESFGGCLALNLWIYAPFLMEKIILINPASSFNRQLLLSLGIPLTKIVPDFIYQTSTNFLVPFLASFTKVKEEDRLKLLNAMNKLPLNTVNWRLSLLKDFSLKSEDFKTLNHPVLIIASAADLLLPSVEEGKRLLNYCQNATLEILPDSGHACLLEKDVNLSQILLTHNFI